jgi:hypothetical protein
MAKKLLFFDITSWNHSLYTLGFKSEDEVKKYIASFPGHLKIGYRQITPEEREEIDVRNARGLAESLRRYNPHKSKG